jgi:hypothetical protein
LPRHALQPPRVTMRATELEIPKLEYASPAVPAGRDYRRMIWAAIGVVTGVLVGLVLVKLLGFATSSGCGCGEWAKAISISLSLSRSKNPLSGPRE